MTKKLIGLMKPTKWGLWIGLGGLSILSYFLLKGGTKYLSPDHAQRVREVSIRIQTRLRYHSIAQEYDQVILGQAYHETGGFTSNAFVNGFNCFGISPNGVLAKYDSIESSVDNYVRLIQLRIYQDGGVEPPSTFVGYAEFLKRHKYFEDKITNYINGMINGWKQIAKERGI